MPAPWDGRLITYLGWGLEAERPATPNIAPGLGAYWYSTDTGELSTWADSAWIENIGGSSGIPDAPSDGKLYGRIDATWAEIIISLGLSDLTDVDLTTPPTLGQALLWDPASNKWKPGTVSGGGGGDPGGDPVFVESGNRWRVLTTAAGSGGGVEWGSVRWADRNGFLVDTTSTATASSSTPGHDADQARDGTHGTYWQYDSAEEPAVGSWWEQEYVTAFIAGSVYLAPGNGRAEHAPEGFEVQYFSNSQNAWITLATETYEWLGDGAIQFMLDPTEAIELVPEAPNDGKIYGRKDKAWIEIEEGIPDAPEDGQTYGRRDNEWVIIEEPEAPPFTLGWGFNQSPEEVDTIMWQYAFAENVDFGINLVGSIIFTGTPPGAGYNLRFRKNGTLVAVITLMYDGSHFINTSGVPVSFSTGDILSIDNVIVDATLADVSITFKGVRV